MSRDTEVRDVTARLENLLDTLHQNVAALNAILAPPDDVHDTPPEEVTR